MNMTFKKKILVLLSVGCLFFNQGCDRILDEQERSSLSPEYFKTPEGIQAGVVAAYSLMRFLWGTEGFSYSTSAGTDEMLRGDGSSSNLFTYGILTSEGTAQAIWDISYQAINNCNGVIELGPAANMPAATKQAVIAEAKFLRAWYYFLLVQTFGEVSLNLNFVTEPSTSASRQPIADVYAAIIKDLKEASVELPDKPSPSPGRAAKAVALHVLAKVYLTKGWSSAATGDDFANAQATAQQLIADKAKYGLDLWQDFFDANKEGNEYGKETIWVIDRNTDATASESGYGLGFGANNPKQNGSLFYWRPNYSGVALNVNAGISGLPVNNNVMMDRDVVNGRPFLRFRPSAYTQNVAFGERVNDTRYNKTFQTVWIYNRTITINTLQGPLRRGIDTAIWMIGREVTEEERRAFRGVLFAPSQYTGSMYPAMKKYDDITRLTPNDPSDRPFIMFRFADTYMVAAEAAFKAGKLDDAANHINVIRQRAAFLSSRNAEQNAAAANAMKITTTDLNIDFIMDERTREFYGEYQRWYDLVRTKTLKDRLAKYNPIAGFKDFHYLRPIPQSQINLVTTGTPYPQNPGY